MLAHAYPGYPEQIHGEARTPEARIRRERLELGVDHALVGGVLARRWGLPNRLALAIERHHADDAEGEAALVRLADMLAHYGARARPSRPTSFSMPRRPAASPPSSCGRSCTSFPRAARRRQAPRGPVPALRA